MTFERMAHGFAASPVSSTTAAEVSSHEVSIPRIRIDRFVTPVRHEVHEEHEDHEEYLFVQSFLLRVLRVLRVLRGYVAAGCCSSNARLSDSVYGARNIPRSVMIPAMNRCSVTSAVHGVTEAGIRGAT